MPPTADPLASALAKVKWAKERINDVARYRPALNQAVAEAIVMKDEPNVKYKSAFLKHAPVIPPEYALVAGDVIHNLRSALDHLAWALCAAGPGGRAAIDALKREERGRIQFPISVGNSDNYKALPSRRQVITLSKLGTEDALDATEPYTGGAGDALAKLSALDNIDKHRLLITVGLQAPSVDLGNVMLEELRAMNPELMSAFPPGSMPVFYGEASTDVLKAGDKIVSGTLFLKNTEKVNFSMPVAFDEPALGTVERTDKFLLKLADFVGGLIPKFRSLV